MQSKGLIFLGASGNVGQYALQTILKSNIYQRITLISRRPLPELEALDKRIHVQIVDLNNISSLKIEPGTTSGLMTLGAGKASQLSKEELERVDADIPIKFAQVCKSQGVQHFSVLSAVGADINGKWCAVTRSGAGGGWYNHVKAKMEEGTKAAGFQSVVIFRPAAIVGNSNTMEFLSWLNPKIDGVLPDKYKSIHVEMLGRLMGESLIAQESGKLKGHVTYEGASLQNLVPK